MSKAPAISRAAAVLRLLGKSAQPMGVNAIARELALVPSTCLYVLRALVEEELVAFDENTKRYTLEAGVLSLARGWLRRNGFAALAQPSLDRLAREHGMTMLGVQVVGMEHIILVAAAVGGGNFQLSAEVGSRFPALISATGRCIAAFGGHTAESLKKKFATLRWDNPPAFEEWMEQVEQTRAQGFGVDQSNYISGVTVVAAPVMGRNGGVSHALITLGITSVIDRVGAEVLGRAMLHAAQGIGDSLPT
ncbi:MAG: IclR family transcriptional regulator [Novosphingobium sp.]|nr:IclR family transcriptional regulator [Novosphingobium sp.]